MEKKKLAIVGCGKLADIVVDALLGGILDDYELIGSYSRTFEKAQQLAERINTADTGYSCIAQESISDIIALNPDYIVEAAAPVAMRELALPALKNGSSIVTLSIGALADEEFYLEVQETAKKHGTRVHLVSGSIGGFDVLRTASLMGDSEVSFATEKSPRSLRDTEVYETELETQKKQVFSGNAKEAIALFPTKVNVAVAASLASVGPKNIKVSVTSVPEYIGDDHRIEIKNEEVHAIVDVYSKTSKIAGWSVVNTLRNITSPIVF
ncbi:aspartate dehydrogenase domain-containing protein [Galbibacter sp.]|uniref:aspartate dehydrogenase domain-containing protein n=1 Tax=Galbibacter sp. TaxID=2918471 RepID=UPI003A95AE1F